MLVLEKLCHKILSEWPEKVKLYREGKPIFGFFMGLLVKETKGNLNREEAEKLLRDLLDKPFPP